MNVPNLFRKFFRDSPRFCFTSKRSKETGGRAWLTMNCSLNNSENLSKKVIWPSGRSLNHCRVVLVNVPMNILQCMVSVPLEMIIWALNVVR